MHEVCNPYNEHCDQNGAGEVGGLASAQTSAVPEIQEEAHRRTTWQRRQSLLDRGSMCGAKGRFLDKEAADDETDRHTGKAEEEHDVGDAIDGVEWGQPIEGGRPGAFPWLPLSLDAALLREVEDGGERLNRARKMQPAMRQCGQ